MKVAHATFGQGVVITAKAGFPKVAVQFQWAGKKSIERSALTILSVPLDPRAAERALICRLEVSLKGPGRAPGSPVKRDREPWDDRDEMELVCRVPKSAFNKTELALLLQRSEDAIDFAWRWCDHANFPSEADDRIKQHVAAIEQEFGRGIRGSFKDGVPKELMRLCVRR
jgi:hypothetical protein